MAWNDKINVRKRYPGYLNMWIIRIGWLLVLALVAADVYMNAGLTGYWLACPGPEACQNPFYSCAYSDDMFQRDCSNSVPEAACSVVPCDRAYINPGESYGRQDALASYGAPLLFFLIAAIFGINHLDYKRRTGSWKYRRELHE